MMNSPPTAWVEPIQMQRNVVNNAPSQRKKAADRRARQARAQRLAKLREPQASQLEAAPLAVQRRVKSTRPQMVASDKGNGGIRVRHREYIQDVSGSVAYSVSSFPLNPGMAATFPWLSTMAQLYESYRFHALRFLYETQKSASTNGSILMGVDFDAADAAPANKQQLMSFEGAVRSGVWQECAFSAKPQSLHKFGPEKFNRSTSLSANQDIKTYDAGNLFVATKDCADATAIGELYVEYDVEFKTPQINASGVLGGSFVNSTGVASATPMGTAGSGTILGSLISGVTATTVSLQNLVVGQEYLICCAWPFTGSLTAAVAPTVVGLTLKTLLSGTDVQNAGGIGNQSMTYTATATSATWAPTVTLVNATAVDFMVCPAVNSSF